MYPMRLIPVFKDYLWGGNRLVSEYHKPTDLNPVAESWEVSCHPDGLSIIANGAYAGKTLAEVLNSHPEFIGKNGAAFQEFPILIKLIDAADNLSLQVHPNDAYARRVEGQAGKNEMWYVLDANPGAFLILGCKTPLTQEEIRNSIEAGDILEIVNKVPVKAGDCFQIPAGLLHAIGAGILIAEVQQSSNLTYRVYDYGRIGADGQPRQLHIDQAVKVIDPALKGEKHAMEETENELPFTRERLTEWEYFQADIAKLNGTVEMKGSEDSFSALLVLKGDLLIQSEQEKTTVKAGESVFLPAGMGRHTWQGSAKILMVRI